MRFTRIRASRSAVIVTVTLALAMIVSMVGTSIQREDASAQGVSWLSTESVNYLTSSGIPVMVPSWIPGPVSGTSPEMYAGGGSYSIYFYSGSSFLFIKGVAGGGFPGGSEANLNVELSVNVSVQGWPAIQDIGIPEGSTTPIYDKVMWIADGVLYTIMGNGLDSDSLSLANSSVALYASEPAPAPTEPPVVEEAPPANTGGNTQTSGDETSTQSTTQSSSQTSTSSGTSTGSDATDAEVSDSNNSTTGDANEPTPTPTGSSDGTSGAWFTGVLNAEPSDGTDGANPPILAGDGTGGPP